MLTADAMNGFKDHVKKTVSHAMYKINSSYYRAEITDIYVDSTGKVAIYNRSHHERHRKNRRGAAVQPQRQVVADKNGEHYPKEHARGCVLPLYY